MATKLPYVLPFEDGSVVAAILLKAQALPDKEQIATKTELQQATAYLATLSNSTMAPQSAVVKRETDNLQAQIDNIVRAPESGGDVAAEVAQARVGADSTNYQTLKERLDTEEGLQGMSISALTIGLNGIERGSYSHGVKANENKRLRTKQAYYVESGSIITFTSSTLYMDVLVFENELSDESQNSIFDSGWIQHDIAVPVSGWLVLLFGNGETYATSTNISLSDYDNNSNAVRDLFQVTLLRSITESLEQKTESLSLQFSANLTQQNTTELTPCYIPPNSQITMSTADGTAMGVSGGSDLKFYNQSKEQVAYWHWGESSSARTVVNSTEETFYYLRWSKPIAKEVQVEISSSKTEYQEYKKNLLGSIYDLYEQQGAVSKFLYKSMADYTCEMGTIVGGAPQSHTKRIRTAGYIPVSGIVTVSCDNGANIGVGAYNEFKQYIRGQDWSSVVEFNDSSMRYIKIVARKSTSNPEIDPSEIYDVAGHVTIQRPLTDAAFSKVEDSLGTDIQYLVRNGLRKTKSANYPTLCLLHFSDLHGRRNRLQTILDFMAQNQSMYNISDAILTGDIVFQKYSNGMDWFDAVSGSENILLAIGNHDATEGVTDYERSDHTEAELYTQYFASRISNWNVEYTSGHTYYYKDYTDNHIRLIVINSMLTGADWTAQETWLTQVLDTARQSDLAVLIACHYRCNDAGKLSSNFTDYGKVLVNYSVTYMPNTMLQIVQDFIDLGGSFICYLCGHMHTDVVLRNSNFPDQLFVAIVDAYGWQNYDSDLDRAAQPDAFNLVLIDKSNHCLKLIRVGADCDPYGRSRKSISIDYNTGNIISFN